MKILFLSYYFVPDICAGAFRSSSIVDTLNDEEEISEIDVITTQPNRYTSTRDKLDKIEKNGKIRIVRFYVPFNGGGIIKQSLSFLFYFIQALWFIRGEKFDLIFATSSRLMTGYLGAVCSKMIKAPLYLDVRDLFLDTIRDLYIGKKMVQFILLSLFQRIERFTFSQPRKINLISAGFTDYFKNLYPLSNLTFYTNGIDEEFLSSNYKDLDCLDEKTKVLYVGNIGEGQGLEKIIPFLALKLRDRASFSIVGDGGTINKLKKSVTGIENVKILGPLKRDEIIELYKFSDILFLHLNDVDAFKKVLPSKLFEYGSTGKPILAGVSGYAKLFCEKELHGLEVFEPCNVDMACTAFEKLELGSSFLDRSHFIGKYSRTSISKKMAKEMIFMMKKLQEI